MNGRAVFRKKRPSRRSGERKQGEKREGGTHDRHVTIHRFLWLEMAVERTINPEFDEVASVVV
jgi:hypothetical protein